ncbi:TonB-dependent receptor [Chitinophaga polysaccharea]|uniref:SusC/RagA family TonB-linked outer membrane protein n=1 Tax=Chitinophaga polysaccharea TaxID=1293035 RepID=UPI001455018B|nr:TonB-dependent receptor [Chitinophaga polysaccharea]NLR56914.1 TonB-dependent receptor [Chitinophaga polysaccharea]
MKKNFNRHGAALCLLLLGVCCSFATLAQNKIKISGTVIDSLSASALPGVTVKVQGVDKGTQTNGEGRFTIDAEPDAILVFSYMGYNRKIIAVNKNPHLYVQLAASNEKLNEVVVVGYGQQKKISVTGAVSSVQTKDIRQSSSASLANALSGRLPGLTAIQSGGGQPGRDDATMYLRGAATTNGTNPLILIDGVPRDNIRTIDPNEVASVTVLKDASATAVFGVRGANGVILITTRRGQPGKAELNISVDQSYSSFTREPERLHSVEYMALRNEAAKNDGITTPPFPQEIIDKYANPLAGLDPKDPDYANKARIRNYIYPDHDYYREYISRYSPQTRVNVSLNGGTDKVAYFANATYLHQGGNLKTEPKSQLGYDPSSKLDRYSFRSNLDYKITRSLKAFLNIGTYIERVNMPSAGLYPGSSTDWMITDLIYQAQTILPITPGPTTIDGFGVPTGKIVDPGYMDRSAFEIMNRFGYRNEVRSNLNSTLGLEWDLSKTVTKGLSLKGMISYDSKATTAMQGYKTEQLYLAQVNYQTNELSYALKRSGENRLSLVKGADSRYNINLQGGINYNRTFGGKHDVGGMVLAQRDYWESPSGEIPFNVVGVAARATYGYDNRYLAEVNMGYNGSEQFAPGKRYGFFPAVSIGWAVSNEKFLKGNQLLTNLKLRASYGKVGNDKMGDARFLYLSDITMGGGPLGSLGMGQGINQGLLGNTNITWELAKKQNYGVDLELLGSLGITFDYFIENRSDILISRGTIPQLQGVPLDKIPRINMGQVDNKGFEIELTYNKSITRDLHLNFRGNFGYNHNTVKFIDEAINSDAYAYRYRQTGFSLGQSWGYKIDYSNGNGYFNSQEELDKYLSHTAYGFGSPRVGDFKYIDLNGDGIVDDKDLAPIKYTSIPGIVYGSTLALGYKGVDLTIFFQGVGRYSSNYANQGVYEYIIQGTYFDYHKTAWTAERYAKGEKITYPALSTRSNTNHTANDFFIMDRSFLRLKNIELAYTLPPGWLKRASIKAVRIYVSAQNLLTWDKLKMGHLDPESTNSIGYPVTRMMNFGFNATF